MWSVQNQYKLIYKTRNYGAGPGIEIHTKIVSQIINQYKLKRVLDYGCGKHNFLLKKLNELNSGLTLYGYDFALEDNECANILHNNIDFNFDPDLLVSTDCLEHIPENELHQCWIEFNRINPLYMYLAISCYPAQTILPDGTNAHKTVKEPSWWQEKLENNLPNHTVVPINEFNSALFGEAYFFITHKYNSLAS